MQRFEENSSINETTLISNTAAGLSEETGYCETTRRIVIISPSPSSLHQLLQALTARCFDVMLFHHADDPLLAMLQPDLLILDRTKGSEATGEAAGRFPKTTVLSLVADERADASKFNGNILHWPSPVEAALAVVEKLAFKGNGNTAESRDLVQYKDLELDLKRVSVYRSGLRMDLTKTEFDLLQVLLQAGGRVLTRQEMLDLVWGDHYFGGSNTVDVHIKSLRQKLGDDSRNPKYIATVRGVGYRLAD